jgi:hypothetical protein
MRDTDIFAYFPEKKLDTVKHILNILLKKSKLPISKIEYGQFLENMSVCFRVSAQDARYVTEKMMFNNIDVFPIDDFLTKIIDEINEKMYSKDAGFSKDSLEELSSSTLEKLRNKEFYSRSATEEQLSRLFKQGNYKQLFEIIKNTTIHHFEIIKRAKELLIPTIRQAIQLNYIGGVSSNINTKNFINNLIVIISDERIKVITDYDLIKEASSFLIELCAQKDIKMLIDIANLTKIKHDINIAAVIKFAMLVKPQITSYIREIDYAIKNLNIKYLLLCYDVASVNFNAASIESYTWLIDLIEENKKKEDASA